MKRLSEFVMSNTFFFGMVFFTMVQFNSAFAQEDAQSLFRHNCMSCHSIEQNLVGPALKGVTERRDSAWLYSFIKNSQEMILAGDPLAVDLFNRFNKVPMPPFTHLSDEEIAAILRHIESEAQQTAMATADQNPIPRPEEFYGANYRQFTFSDIIFWLPMTITVILLIVTLVAFTHAHDALKEARNETVVPQEEL